MFSRKRRGRFPRLPWCVLFLPTNFTFHSPFLFPPSSFLLPPSFFLSFAPVGALRRAARRGVGGARERLEQVRANCPIFRHRTPQSRRLREREKRRQRRRLYAPWRRAENKRLENERECGCDFERGV